MGFLTVVQDGDDEGVLKLVDLPTADEAAIIRKLVGLRKVAPLTDEQRATLNRFSFARDKPPFRSKLSTFRRVAATTRLRGAAE